MECREAIDRLIELDPGQTPDRTLIHHLESCEKCHDEWQRFTAAIESLKHADPVRADDELPLDPSVHIDTIMEAVVWRPVPDHLTEPADSTPENGPGLQMRSWVLGGVTLLVGILMTPYIVPVREFRIVGGVGAGTAVALGIIVTAYASVFVRANLQQLTRFVRRLTG